MSLNKDKCFIVSFSRKSSNIMFDYTPEGSHIKRTDTYKDLGVMFDSELSFKDHIENTVSAAYKTLAVCKIFSLHARR